MPGLKQFHIWIWIPFFIIYLYYLSLFAGNSILLYLIFLEHSLHEPMFFFLSMLATTDLCNTCATQTFSIFCLGPQHIMFPGCHTQMFFLHFSLAMDSAILLAMAFDHYVTICFPLRYTTIITYQIITKIVDCSGNCHQELCIIFPSVKAVAFLLSPHLSSHSGST